MVCWLSNTSWAVVNKAHQQVHHQQPHVPIIIPLTNPPPLLARQPHLDVLQRQVFCCSATVNPEAWCFACYAAEQLNNTADNAVYVDVQMVRANLLSKCLCSSRSSSRNRQHTIHTYSLLMIWCKKWLVPRHNAQLLPKMKHVGSVCSVCYPWHNVLQLSRSLLGCCKAPAAVSRSPITINKGVISYAPTCCVC